MIKYKLIRGIINISSIIQTSLINYLEFHSTKPREPVEKGYSTFSSRPEKPESVSKPFQKEDVIKPNYKVLLSIAQEQGRIINPIRRRQYPLRTNEKCCRKCKAPQEYLRNHGFYTRKSTDEKFPRHTCKICFAEYAPGTARKKVKHQCPYCGYAMSLQNYRKNFNVYFCKHEACPHKKLHPKQQRYSERDWHFDYHSLKTVSFESKKQLESIRLSKHVLDLEMSLFIEVGITTREVVKVLQKIYGENIIKSHQSVLNHSEALASYIYENEDLLPTKTSDTVVQDETYIKYSGKWGYLFRAKDPVSRAIISEHLSKYRDTKGCITLNKGVRKEYLDSCKDPEYALVSDAAPIYGAMTNYFNDAELSTIHHKPVKGLKSDPQGPFEEYRPLKQIIERSFGTLKSNIKRRRGFSSFRGAEIFCFLHKIYYNHLRPHMELNKRPPVPLFLKSGRQVTNWNELLQYLAERKS